jgi:arylsulfatase A-like enzyme
MAPHVLLVVLDAARRDSLEPYGAPAGASPAIAQLANRGTAHQNVYSTACWTVPSHASMFTGLMPRAAGLAQVRSAPEARPIIQAHRTRLLPEVMRRAGYRSLGVSANVWVSSASGYDTGFEPFVLVDSGRHARMHKAGVRERLRWVVEGALGRADDGAREVEKVLERSLRDPEQPFFCFVNLLECHSPYLPPRPYGGSLLERARTADDARRYWTLDSIWRTNLGAATVPKAALERARRMYTAAIRYMDDWLARVLERLDSAGILDETLVIVMSDHGENLGEGGRTNHALSLDNRLIHVPFVAAGPGCSQEINSLASLPRFVAEAAGVAEHPFREEPPPGYGMAQFDPPVAPDDDEMLAKVRQVGLEDALEALTTPLSCAVDREFKLLRRGDREEAYDLARDPLELNPLDPSQLPDDRVTALRGVLDHPVMTGRSSIGEQEAAPPPAPSEDEMRDLEERMKLLGYL